MKTQKEFPNGFESWQETHFEIVTLIAFANMMNDTHIQKILETQGQGGLYEIAENLTNKFEKINEGRDWDGEYFDEIEEFFNNEIKTI